MAKIFFIVAVLLAFAAYAYAAIPSNCLPCPNECSIICKNINRDICRVNECKVPNSPSTNLDRYNLVFRIIPCTNLEDMQAMYCSGDKLPDGFDVLPA